MSHLAIPAGVHVVFSREDGAVLLMRRSGTGFFDGLYSLPGGHVEAGERVVQTAVREAREELDITVAPQDLAYVGVMHRLSDTHRLDFFMAARVWSGVPRIAEPDKCDDLRWVFVDALPANTVPYIAAALREPVPPARACGTAPERGWFLEWGFEEARR